MINLDNRTYKISFQNSSTVYLTDKLEEFTHLLKAQNLIVDKITVTQDRTGKFKRLSKKDLLCFVSWNTELSIELKKRNLI